MNRKVQAKRAKRAAQKKKVQKAQKEQERQCHNGWALVKYRQIQNLEGSEPIKLFTILGVEQNKNGKAILEELLPSIIRMTHTDTSNVDMYCTAFIAKVNDSFLNEEVSYPTVTKEDKGNFTVTLHNSEEKRDDACMLPGIYKAGESYTVKLSKPV